MNFIVNARDAICEKQQQRNTKQRGEIVVGCQFVDRVIEITVQDNGCGMSEQTRKKLFEPFYTTKEVGEGTGLGLSISYSIIQKHEGEVVVETQLGGGSTFKLFLPTK
jgi:two-component system NtrC family sensor kinase